MKTVIIKYHGGNVQSVDFALQRLGIIASVTGDPETIQGADYVIFPGVGEARSTMRYLRETRLDQLIPTLTQPVLGICLGMQLLCRYSAENDTLGLGIYDVDVVRFPPKTVKVPHIGWNKLNNTKDWLAGVVENKFAYFVHSFLVPLNRFTVASSTHGAPFSAALRKDNFFAVQFHPEKSADCGVEVLNSFFAASQP